MFALILSFLSEGALPHDVHASNKKSNGIIMGSRCFITHITYGGPDKLCNRTPVKWLYVFFTYCLAWRVQQYVICSLNYTRILQYTGQWSLCFTC
jgi:hypothetical protein